MGKIVQIIGAVIDVEFPRDQIPKVYDALKLDDVDLTLEVQQQQRGLPRRGALSGGRVGWCRCRRHQASRASSAWR